MSFTTSLEDQRRWSICFHADVNDLLSGASLFRKSCKAGRTLRLFKIFACIWLGSFALIALQHRSIPTQPYALGVAAAALWILFGMTFQQKRAYRKLFATMAAPDSTLPITIEWDSQQISFQLRGKSEARFFWTAVLGSVEDRTTFLLLPSKNVFYYIPKRALEASALEALRIAAPKGTGPC